MKTARAHTGKGNSFVKINSNQLVNPVQCRSIAQASDYLIKPASFQRMFSNSLIHFLAAWALSCVVDLMLKSEAVLDHAFAIAC